MKTRRRTYTPPLTMASDFIAEVHADDFSDMESTDESSDDEAQNDDKLPGVVLQTDISTEEEFEGFGEQHFLELPTHFDRNADFMEGWENGSRVRQNLPFRGRTGLGQFIEMPKNPTPLDFFDLFIQEGDYEEMAIETNKYYVQSTEGKNLKPNSRVTQWYNTNAAEMKVFIATTIAMALVVQRDITDYWSTNDVTSTPFFRKVMTRDRFWLLVTYLHLDDNTRYPGKDSPAYTPLNKLGRLYKRVIHRFSKVYIPHRHISVDEGMVPWRGNLSFRVYNPDKPKKYGMKAYMLCDSENGYVCKFKLYTGKVEETVSEFGKTYDLVMDLVRDYQNKGYHIFMDNFYSSPTLYVNLWERGFGATGTLRPSRKGTPKIMGQQRLKEKQEKGDMITMHNKNLLCVRYQDKKPVVLMSTVEDVQQVETGRVNRATGVPVEKPRILDQYNKYMGGVDRADQMLSYTPFKMRTLKWWKRVWFHVVNVALLNAYVVYKELSEKPHKSSRRFRREIVERIIADANPEDVPTLRRRPRGRPSTSAESLTRLHGRHFPSKIEPVGRKKNISRACVVCSKAKRMLLKSQAEEDGEPVAKRKRVGRESSFECEECNVALCAVPCFRIYHTCENYCNAYIKETTPAAALEEEEEDLTED